MLGSLGGLDRPNISTWSTGNEATPLLEGKKMMEAVHDDLARAGDHEGDYVYFCAWCVQEDIMLMPQADEPQATTVKAMFTNAIAKGATSLSLIWRNIVPPGEGDISNFERVTSFKASIAAANDAVGGNSRAIIDGRTPLPTGSHHQKTLVIKRDGEAVAYVGGIDLTRDRWDTSEHPCAMSPPGDDCATREMEPNQTTKGWEDVHLRLRGPAVRDIAANFVNRWNDDETPSNVKPFEPVPPKIEHVDDDEVDGDAGTASVQVVRTYSCSSPVCVHACYQNNAPRGETSHLDALIKAIGQAQNYIYLEDQYFVYEKQVQDALLESMAAHPNLRLIVLTQQPESGAIGYETYQYGMMEPLSTKYPDRFQIYIRSDGVYVHAKTWVIDDVYVLIGSQNLNMRSETYDTEIGAAFVDAVTTSSADGLKVSQLAMQTRCALWSSHVGEEAVSICNRTLDEGAAMWKAAGTDGAKIVPYQPTQTYKYWALRKVIDPDGRCFFGADETEPGDPTPGFVEKAKATGV